VGVDCTDNFIRKKAIEKTILRMLRPSEFSHSLDPNRTSCAGSLCTAVGSSDRSGEARFSHPLCSACAAIMLAAAGGRPHQITSKDPNQNRWKQCEKIGQRGSPLFPASYNKAPLLGDRFVRYVPNLITMSNRGSSLVIFMS